MARNDVSKTFIAQSHLSYSPIRCLSHCSSSLRDFLWCPLNPRYQTNPRLFNALSRSSVKWVSLPICFNRYFPLWDLTQRPSIPDHCGTQVWPWGFLKLCNSDRLMKEMDVDIILTGYAAEYAVTDIVYSPSRFMFQLFSCLRPPVLPCTQTNPNSFEVLLAHLS